jgi:hypothetical protein
LQALDQYNKKFHEAYTKERRRFQELRRLNGHSETLNTADFVSIVCTIWPFWSTPSDRRSSFQKVGILQDRIASDLVDRSKFTATMPLPPPVSLAFLRGSLGIHRGSLFMMKHTESRAPHVDGRGIACGLGEGFLGVLRGEVRQGATDHLQIIGTGGEATLGGCFSHFSAKKGRTGGVGDPGPDYAAARTELL